MKRFSILTLAGLLVCAMALVSYAVTSEPEPSAGAPATSAPPTSSSSEQHKGKDLTKGEGAKDDTDKKQEAQEQKAITHTKEAIKEGKAGKAAGLAKHAEIALKIAEKADKRHAESHVEEGIKHLQMAVDEGKKGNAAEGTKHAEEALTQLQKE